MATGNSFTNYLQAQLLNWLRGTGFASAPANIYLGLFTAAPGEAGGGTEVTGGSYARVAVPFGAPANQSSGTQIANSGTVSFATPTANWGTATHFAFFDALTGGNMLFYGTLTSPQTINSGANVSFPAGNFTFLMD